MTVLYEKDETATFGRMTETTLMPVASGPADGARIDVNGLSRRLRVRTAAR